MPAGVVITGGCDGLGNCGGAELTSALSSSRYVKREFFIDHLLDRIHFIVMIRWTGLSLNSLFQVC